MATVLLTGGAGYIGSHTAVELCASGHQVVIIDNLSNSCAESVHRVEELTGQSIPFYEADVRDRAALDGIFTQYSVDAVIHFAGLKAVGESVQIPLQYYRNNIDSTLTLLEAMEAHRVNAFIFSSSATVYGTSTQMPLREDAATGCTNPYGRTKLFCEGILTDAAMANPNLSVVLLRYFNPVGAHESGRIGEDPSGIPNNLMPYITQVAAGKLEKLRVFGNDYPTPDGTGVRDYLHVVDLAKGHVAAVPYALSRTGVDIINLGTGKGSSVLEVVSAFQRQSGIELPYEITARRPGDIAECYADAEKARIVLGWTAEKTLDDMCRDAWNWQKNNPNGYRA